MWHIEIRDNSGGASPGKLRQTHVSKLPDCSALNRIDRFAVMTRIPATTPPAVASICGSCKRKVEIALHIKRQKELRVVYGSNVSAFPVFATRREN
jgi:hypothetical protein